MCVQIKRNAVFLVYSVNFVIPKDMCSKEVVGCFCNRKNIYVQKKQKVAF